MSNVFATDVDGCLLDWHSGFIEFCNEKGWMIDTSNPQNSYDMEEWFLPHFRTGDKMSHDMFVSLVKEFNSYPRPLKMLEGARDALEMVKQVKRYKVVAITSFNNCPEQAKFRKDYLEAMFPDIFDDVIVLGLGECKKETLKKIKPEIFIEDCRTHADNAVDLGIDTYIFERSYNQGSKATYIEDWYDVQINIFGDALLEIIMRS